MGVIRSVLVTGGAGFIGSAVCRHLVLSENCRVLNVDKLTYAGNLSSLAMLAGLDNYAHEQADICDGTRMAELFQSFQPDAVMHLAAESHVDRSIDGPDAFIQTNIVGTYNLLHCARQYCASLSESARASFRFLHISTDEVYGSLGAEGLFTEDTPYDPRSPYSASKAASDHLAMAWYHTYDFPVLISNCSNNYGPYHFPEKLIPLVILNALNEKALPIYGQGDNVRDWLYVEDHARALHLILTTGEPGQTYNVGGNNERTNLEVVHQICDALDTLRPRSNGASYRDLITFVPDRPGHDKRYAIDATKLKTQLGWQPQEDFDSGIQKTVQWYLDNESWWGPIRSGKYAGERLGNR